MKKWEIVYAKWAVPGLLLGVSMLGVNIFLRKYMRSVYGTLDVSIVEVPLWLSLAAIGHVILMFLSFPVILIGIAKAKRVIQSE